MGKMRKLKETELIGGTQNIDIYPVTHVDAVYDSSNKSIGTIIEQLKRNATFAGIATPTTNPGTITVPAFYFATEAGTYNNFNGVILGENGLTILYNLDGTWKNFEMYKCLQKLGNSTNFPMSQKAVTEAISSGEIYNTIELINETSPLIQKGFYDRSGVLHEGGNFSYVKVDISNCSDLYIISNTYGSIYNCLFDENSELIPTSIGYSNHYSLSTFPEAKYLGVSTVGPLVVMAKVKSSANFNDIMSLIDLDSLYRKQKITINTITAGFYDARYKLNFNERIPSKTTLVKVYPGMEINFTSYAFGSAVNYIIFNNEFKIISSKSATNYSSGGTLTVPESASYVMFSSLGALSVDLGNNDTQGTNQSQGGILYGKKYVAIGDSFTDRIGTETIDSGAFSGQSKVYPYIIGNRNNMKVLNQGMSGSVLNGYLSRKLYNNIPEDVDYVTIWYGINDAGHGIGIGTIDDEPASISTEKDTTTCGAFNFMFKWLLTNRPYAHIGVIVTDFCEPLRREAIIACCQKWGIAYLDLYDPTIPMIRTRGSVKFQHSESIAPTGYVSISNEAIRLRANSLSITPPSNIHPSNKCHEWQSNMIENFMRSL